MKPNQIPLKNTLFLLIANMMLVSSCQRIGQTTFNAEPEPNASEYMVMATLYNYFAAEYKALAYQAFNTATVRADAYRAAHPDARNLAIIVDIDETLLDNSPYQAKMIELNAVYDSCWNSWCNLAAARAVPGSIHFLTHADSLGYQIFYVSNRKNKTVRKGTMENLQQLGFPQVNKDHLYLRNNTSDKEPRRNKIAENHDIVLLVGDNIGDFYEDTSDSGRRDSLVRAYRDDFGKKFIVLPNAMYGSWPASIGIKPGSFPLDSLLEVMTNAFGDTCPD